MTHTFFKSADQFFRDVRPGASIVCTQSIEPFCRAGDRGTVVALVEDRECARLVWHNDVRFPNDDGLYNWDWFSLGRDGASIAVVENIDEWEGELELE